MEKAQEALKLRLDGKTFAEIGAALGISRQRAQQLTSPPTGVRLFVAKRAEGKCEHCQIPIRAASGHVHHKLANGQERFLYNDSANLEYLCPSCHRVAHFVPRPAMESPRTMEAMEIREWRQERKLSQRRLAQLLGVASDTVARWERGEQAPAPYLCLALETLERRQPTKAQSASREEAEARFIQERALERRQPT